MIKLLKVVSLFFAFNFTISCNLWSLRWCDDYSLISETFSGKIKFEEYSANNMSYTEKFAFFEGDSFSYLKITRSGNDTIEKFNGKFKIYKDGKYSWHIFKLSSDSIYTKQMTQDTLDGSLHFSSDFTATKFLGFSDSLLTNKIKLAYADDSTRHWSIDSTCFNLGYGKVRDNDYDCNDGYHPYYPKSPTTFCLNQPEETPEQNSIGDSL